MAKNEKYLLNDEDGEIQIGDIVFFDGTNAKVEMVGDDWLHIDWNDELIEVLKSEVELNIEEGMEMEGNPEDAGDITKAKDMADKNNTDVTIRSDNEEDDITITSDEEVVEGIVSVRDLKSTILSEVNGEINLTEQDIMNILVTNEEARMTKSELIQEIQSQIIKEANMDDSIRRNLDGGSTDYSEHLDADTIKRLADEMFDNIKTNAENKGVRGIGQAQQAMMNSLMQTFEIEGRHREELEQLAIKMTMEEFNMPEGSIDIEASIVQLGQVNKGTLKYGPEDAGDVEDAPTVTDTPRGVERPTGEEPQDTPRDTPRERPTRRTRQGGQPKRRSKQELKPELTKRRLINALIHGAARKSQYLYHMSDRIREIDPNLSNHYSNIMLGNDLTYWGMSDGDISSMGRMNEQHAGNVRVETVGLPRPKIVAQAINFPMLLHELSKGVVEVLGLHGQPKDIEEWKYVKGKVDHLDNETWDIRIGPKIWEKIMEIIPADAVEHKATILMKLFKLPAEEFNGIVSGVLNNDQDSIDYVKDLADDILGIETQKHIDTTLSQYSDDYEGEEDSETTLDGDDEEVDDVLGLGKDEEEEEFDPSKLSKSELQELIDQALDDEDYETVQYLSDYL